MPAHHMIGNHDVGGCRDDGTFRFDYRGYGWKALRERAGRCGTYGRRNSTGAVPFTFLKTREKCAALL